MIPLASIKGRIQKSLHAKFLLSLLFVSVVPLTVLGTITYFWAEQERLVLLGDMERMKGDVEAVTKSAEINQGIYAGNMVQGIEASISDVENASVKTDALLESLAEECLESEGGMEEFERLRSIEEGSLMEIHYAVYQHVEDFEDNWAVASNMISKKIQGSITSHQVKTDNLRLRSLYLIAGLFLLTGVVVSASSYILARRGLGPIQRLREGAREVAKGNLDYSIEVETEDEIGVLAQEFNHMTQKLKDALEQLYERYADLEKEMKHRKETEEQFSTLVETASDVIFTISDRKLTTLNRAFETFTGFKREDWIGENYLHLVCPDDQEFVGEISKRVLSGESIPHFEIRILTNEGQFKWGDFSANPLTKGGKVGEVFCVVRDITDRKRVEEEIKRQLMKFDLEDGTLYLVKESSPTMAIEAFKDMLKIGSKGYVVSRTPEDEFRRDLEEDFDYFWLAETGEDAISVEELEANLQTLPRKSAILIDRLDYMIFKDGFKKTLSFIHRLREFSYLYSYVVIISLDPETLDNKELILLEKETRRVQLLHKDALRPDLMDVVSFIYKQNSRGIKPSYNDIGRAIGLSKPTIYKRMKVLNASGYLKEVMKGRQKAVEVNEKGKRLFKK